MNGTVDGRDRALVRVTSADTEMDVWIDTGFTGDLVLPRSLVTSLKLQVANTVKAELGDGSEATLDTYSCVLE